jgi:hypothetical protein
MKDATDLCRTVSKLCQRETGVWACDISDRAKITPMKWSEVLESESVLQEVSSRCWYKLCKVYENPWFERVWVVHEAALAACPTIQVGQHTCTWVDLGNTVEWLC